MISFWMCPIVREGPAFASYYEPGEKPLEGRIVREAFIRPWKVNSSGQSWGEPQTIPITWQVSTDLML